MTTTIKCFVAGTLVLNAISLVIIKKIKLGDMLYAVDTQHGIFEHCNKRGKYMGKLTSILIKQN